MKSPLDRLRKTAERTNLDEFVAARTRRSLLLVDCSSSMGDHVITGERKIDKLRAIVETLRATHPVPMAAFGLRSSTTVELVESIPEPAGMTPLHRAIDFGRVQEANHLVVVTDGHPDSGTLAYAAADAFQGPIDVFFIGDEGDAGARFCTELARRTGGKFGLTDLSGAPKELAGRIQLLLGDGGVS
jgi:hypothetical protein